MKSHRSTNDAPASRRLPTTSDRQQATTQEICVKNTLSELARVSSLVQLFGTAHGLSPRTVFEITLALDEVLTNVITYAYEDRGEHDIRIGLSLANGQLVVAVEDDGRPFNPLEVSAPPLDGPATARPVGGVGIYLVRQVVDHLEYTRHADRNILVMTKNTGERATEG